MALAVMIIIAHPGTAQGPKEHQDRIYSAFVKEYTAQRFSPEAFQQALLRAGFPEHHIDAIMKHARIESGNFKSRLFVQQHNAFGMRLAKRRTTTAVGTKKGYAVYQAWYDSVYDYWLWYERKPIKSNQSWASYLKSRKYTNPADAKRESKRS